MQLDRQQELANTWTHAVGVAASVVGGGALIVLAVLRGTAWDVVGVSIFSATLVALYSASTAYHATRQPHIRLRLKVADHCAIYLLIAGSYTPFMIGRLRGGWGWSLFGVIWGLALAGIIFKFFFTGRFKLISTGIYIAMGWLVLIAVGPLLTHLGPATLLWLLAGGIAYTAGTPFYHNARMRYGHAVWHGFVLAGSLCHAIAIATAI